MNIDHLIIGNCPSSSCYSKATKDLIERIANGQDFPSNELIFASTDSAFLAILLLNYPLIFESYYKECAVAVKKISLAKYNCCKKSSAFKESFSKHLNELFNKFHSSDLTEQKDQIQKVNHAVALIKFIGELYNVDYIINCNIKFILEVLIKAAETSKISEICLQVLISIISDHAKNEAKQFHKHNHDVHTAAIMKILAEYEDASFEESDYSNKKKKNYKDLEIIEAVKKMEKNNKNFKQVRSFYYNKNQPNNISSKNEAARQTKKIFETILAGYMSIASCVQTAHDMYLLYPDSFESEMFQLCLEYLKKGLTNVDDNNKNNFTSIGKFIGKLYCARVFQSDTIKSTMSLLSKFEQVEASKDVHDAILNAIYFKVMETNDEMLKQFIPKDFEQISSALGETESDESFTETPGKEEAKINNECRKEEKRPATKASNGEQSSTLVTVAFNVSPINKFKNLMTKLSSNNVAFILREISQIQFASGEETSVELTSILVDQALKRQSLMKTIVHICLKLPDTVVPHFNNALLKKNLKAVISNSVIGCSEQKALGCSQLVKELHIAGIYDRFDIILVLENFTVNFDNDRTALSSLLKFTAELKDLINNNKKLSKNMSIKLKRIGQNLREQINNENYVDYKSAMEMAIKVYNGEYKASLIVNAANNQDNKHDDDGEEEDEEEIAEHRDPDQMLVGSLLLRYPSRKVSPVQYPSMSSPPPQLANSTEIIIINNEPSYRQYAPPPPLPLPIRSFTPERAIAGSSSVAELNRQHSEELYSTVLESGQVNVNVSLGSSYESIHNDDDDQFYDSLATSEEIDNDKLFRFLEECTKNSERMQELRELIFHQISEVNDFVPTMLLLGAKFESIESFVKFFEIVEEALQNQGKKAQDSFKVCLELKYPDFLRRLWNETSQTVKDKNEIEHLVIITGVLYNKSYLSDEFYQKILKNIWKEIENVFHAKIFIRLITTSFAKISGNNLSNICKGYLENLAEYSHSFGHSGDRQVLLKEVGAALKLFMVTPSNDNVKTIPVADPSSFYKNLIMVLNASNINQIINQIKSINTLKKNEMMNVVDYFIAFAISSHQPISVYVKLAEKLQNATASDIQGFTFKLGLDKKLKEEISKCLDDEKNIELSVLKWASFVGDLFLSNVVSIQLLASTFEALFTRETNNKKIVDAIGVLMKKAGAKVDEQNSATFDKFFSYFSLLIASEASYRTTVYKELFELRKNKWKDGKSDACLIETYLSHLRQDNIVEITKLIGEKLCVSVENCNDFVNLLWKTLMLNPQRENIYKYGRFIQGLTFIHANIRNHLMEFIGHRNKTFSAIPVQNFSDSIATKLTFIIHLMCYLYAIDVATDVDLELWIRPQLVMHLNIAQNAELSILLGPKLVGCSNVNVKAFFTFVEFNVRDQLVKAFDDVKNSLK